MDSVLAVILGVIQGLTEFIPVSSSGHLVIGQYFLIGQSSHTFLEFINVGTFFALLVYYWPKIREIARKVVEQRNYTLLRNIVLTSVPAGLVGYVAADVIAGNSFFASPVVVVCALISVGSAMIVLDKLPRARSVDGGEQLPWQRALAIGVAQVFALIPGVSRSGSTIIAGRLSGLSNADAADYSFLASLPIMFAVTLKLFVSSTDRAYFVENMMTLIVGNVMAFIAGIVAIKFLLGYLRNHDLKVFGWYRLGLAAVVIVVLLVQ